MGNLSRVFLIEIFFTLTFFAISTNCFPFQEECQSAPYPPPKSPSIPHYTVNLDKPPKQRWSEVVRGRKNQISNLLQIVKDYIRSFGKFPSKLIDIVDSDLGSVADSLPYPFADEIKGIAVTTGLNQGEVVLFNIFYEIFTVCTSIIAKDSTGHLYHARNLDFGLFMGWDLKNHTWLVTEALRPMIVNIDFQRGNKTLFKSVQFAGYVGIITGFKPGAFSFTMNERFNANGGYIGLLEWFLGIRSGVHWVNFLAREVLENSTSYADARDKLANTRILAPAYYILGGKRANEGCIISRDRLKAVDVWDLGTRNSSWYLLQTNYDHWMAPPFYDDRRTPGCRCMDKMTQNKTSFAGIYNVLSTVPVLNQLTAYTALMQVNSGKMDTFIQRCDRTPISKCAPW